MAKQIRLNAFDMNCVGHQSSGLWRHPRDRSGTYNTLGYWTDLAQTLERGLFDGLFLADVLGVYDVYGGNAHAALIDAAQIPVNDPAMLIPAMAAVTRHLGFGLTCTLSYEPPFPFARRMSTLDHLTEGRIGWNIVTGYLNSAAKGSGLAKQPEHDTRYDIAEEYMQLTYKLWEGSWDDDAVLRDPVSGVFTQPDKVRKVHHDGAYFRVDAMHLCEPSKQRTPVLYQAGASRKGRAFAARHAECVFIAGPSKQVIAPSVADIRKQAGEQGRDPSDILIFTLMTVIVGRTDEEAQAKFDEYRRYVSHRGALTLMSGWTGIDFSQYGLDDELKQIRNDAIHSAVDAFTVADPGKVWTIREIAEFAAIGGTGPIVIGSPERVADELQAWIEETGIDGFNLAYAVTPETFEDFVDLVIPELQLRGVYKTAYAEGSLRNKLFGQGDRLGETHPAHTFRATSRTLAA
ncbi:Dibenzothiophene sulfone monooxygenase [Granulibacter bethesdensis]|uniref:Dibenzothiophene sulfone monooxygenase n=1 Tax=Granulibacter bethesdensis TaxID=364410 RepID=A0AAN0RFZ6_9PROT|nr:LLM class flavin-dependent oxidoreductase [Granulibacter bethesdensis]AHJ64339.1 Dibenzothiophene sulfone monooxygenase [Granulibacter bethesdensis]